MSTLREVLTATLDKKHGPLPRLLQVLSFVTGLVDAFFYLALGHVFVANMTGNVIFVGFALAGAKGFSIPASLVALASFVVCGGILSSLHADHRGRLLTVTTSIQSVFVAVALALSISCHWRRFSLHPHLLSRHRHGPSKCRRAKGGVPDMTTTVLTMTIAGIASDHESLGGPGWRIGRRLSAIVIMFLGALVGALLVIHVSVIDPLAIVLGLTLLVAVSSELLGRVNDSWIKPPSA